MINTKLHSVISIMHAILTECVLSGHTALPTAVNILRVFIYRNIKVLCIDLALNVYRAWHNFNSENVHKFEI